MFLVAFTLLATGCVSREIEQSGESRVGDETMGVPVTGVPTDSIRGDTGGELFDAIGQRRSVRDFEDTPVADEHVALMSWAAQGVTDPDRGFRAAPSAGALYPLELYVASADGLRHYMPERDELEWLSDDDVRLKLTVAALAQGFIAQAPMVFIITGVYARTEHKYRDRAVRYVHLEAGHAAQNLLLVAVHLGLGGVTVGAFSDEVVRRVLGIGTEETPLYIIPVGCPAGA